MEVVKKLAEFVVRTNFEVLPQEAVAAAKKAMLDTLGVALAGSIEPASKVITGFVKKLGDRPVCGVIAGKVRTSPLASR